MTNTDFTDLERRFEEPPTTFGPTPLWWWSGAEVTRERLEWQMRRYAEGGIHNLVVINLAPAGPLVGAVADDPAWFSDAWWDRFIETCELARELGMTIWFYDQIGFSGANVQGSITREHPEAQGQTLRSRVVELAGTAVPLTGTETLLAAYATDGARLPLAPASSAAPLAAVHTGPVRIVTTVPTAFDYLDPAAVRLLMDTIHGEFERRVPEYLGDVVVGSFQDELPATNAWTPAFAEEFRLRRGYDLLDHLPALFEAGDDRAAKIRGDYFAVRAELTEEALFRPLGEWHTARGMLIGSDQSNPARAGFPTQATQLYTDYFRTHRWYGAAGSDHEGDAKVHSSMAHLYGHERVWIESFHSSGWGGTLEDTYDWLLPFFRSGANLYNPHATYFGTAGGWFEWAPPSTDWRQPYWEHYPEFSAAVARIAATMTWGVYSADVAVLHPTANAQSLVTLDAPVDHFGDGQLGSGFELLDEAQRVYLELCGVDNWFVTRLGSLDSHGISFDVIDDDSVQRATATPDGLAIGEQVYRAVVVPAADVLEEDTARRLTELLDAGGRVVVVGRRPRIALGRDGDDVVVQALACDPRLEFVETADAASEALGALAGYATSDVPLLVRRGDGVGAAFVTGAHPNASGYPRREYGDAWLWADHDFDNRRYVADRVVRVAAAVREAEVWNPATGARRAARVTVQGGVSTIDVVLDGAPAVVVVWHEGEPVEPTEPVTAAATTATVVALDDGWTGRLVPTIDNRWGDLALPVDTDLTRVQVWTVDWSEDTGPDVERAWEPVKAGYGNRLRFLGPLPVEVLPGPLDEAAAAGVLAGGRVADDAWTLQRWSASRAREKPGHGSLGLKGIVPEEFLSVPAAGPGEAVRVRTVLATSHRGAAELVVGAGAAKRVWWNGVEQPTSADYLAVVPVVVEAEHAVLEVEFGESENAPVQSLDDAGRQLTAFFTLTAPGTFGTRPVFMSVDPTAEPDGRVEYRATIDVPSAPDRATLIVGAATGLTLSIDGIDVARQEKVEYYEGSWGATPMYFQHDVRRFLGVGTHEVVVVVDSVDSRDVVYVDLVAETPDGPAVLVSGPGWRVHTHGADSETVGRRGTWGEYAPQHAARRPHPLPEAEWLNGGPVDGSPVLATTALDDLRPVRQSFRIVLPSGTTAFDLPLLLPATVTLDGSAVEVQDGRVTLAAALERPGELRVLTDPTAVHRGAAAWSGPLRVALASAPIALGDWRDQALGAWSGGVEYRRDVDLAPGASSVVLDLGRVRGSVTVAVDDVVVARAFCAPFRWELFADGDVPRGFTLSVTVYNTLAPFLDETTPSSWTFPSQLESGLSGPVRLSVR